MKEKGKFGQIHIYDFGGKRWLRNSQNIQAATNLSPSSHIVHPDLPCGPGPVQGCTYTLGWLVVGASYSIGFGIVLGLGGAEGIVSLLFNFPNLHLTVIDIDPTIVDMVRKSFPLVKWYEQQGRLTIHIAAAENFFQSGPKSYDFAIFDLDDASPGIHSLLQSDSFLLPLKRSSNSIWFNLLSRIERSDTQEFFKRLHSLGFGDLSVFSCQPRTMNLIVGNELQNSNYKQFVPFKDLDDPAVQEIRLRYKSFINTISYVPESPDRIKL
ncbi:MAG: hypothetical protein ACN4GR_17470 [Arenicellales bacterium]